MIVFTALAFVMGEPRRLVYGTDYEGNVCGVTEGFTKKPYTAYPRLNADVTANRFKTPSEMKFYGVCVQGCNEDAPTVVCQNEFAAVNEAPQVVLQDIFATCFAPNISTLSYSNASWSIGDKQYTCGDTNPLLSNCWPVPFNTTSMLFRCVPKYNIGTTVEEVCVYPAADALGQPLSASSEECLLVSEVRDGATIRPARTNALLDNLNDASQTWGRYMGDLARVWWVIALTGVVLPLVLALLYLITIQFCTGVIVYTTIILAVLAPVAVCIYSFYRAGAITNERVLSFADKAADAVGNVAGTKEAAVSQDVDSASDNQLGFRIAGYISLFVSLVAFVVVLAIRKNVIVIVKVLSLGAESVRHLGVELLSLPLVSSLATFAITAWFIFVSAYLMSAAQLVKSGELPQDADSSAFANVTAVYAVAGWEPDRALQYQFILVFFGYLWTTQWVSALSFITIAGAVGGWYFSRPVPADSKAPVYTPPEQSPVYTKLWHALRFYTGTAALGSFLVAFVQMLRAIMVYIDAQTRRIQAVSCFVRMVIKCLHCCLWLLECIVKVITRTAFVYVAVKGFGFCTAGACALATIATNFKLLAGVTVLGQVLLWLGKLIVASLCGLCTIFIIENTSSLNSGEGKVYSSWLPAMVAFIVAFFIANMILQVWDAAVDSVIMSYICDVSENELSKPQHFADHDPIAMLQAEGEDKEADSAVTYGSAGDSSSESTRSSVKNPLPASGGAAE